MSDILFDLFNGSSQGIYGDLKKIRDWSDQLYSSPLRTPSSSARTIFNPTKDVFTLDIPGYSREEISIYLVADDKIVITAINKTRGERSLEVYVDSKFSTEDTKITLQDGVLTLKFSPKEKPEPKTLKISD